MQAEFWHNMWQKGQIGFHQSEINAFLQKHWSALELAHGSEILVPLCGKTLDMLWLKKQGFAILGVELSQQALDEFVADNQLVAQPLAEEPFCGYELAQMRLLCGDFFHLPASHVHKVSAVFDRAALVALPAPLRQQYVQHLTTIVPASCQFFVITMEYPPDTLQGPPFSVPEAEVRDLFSAYKVSKLEEVAMQRKGVTGYEKVFHIQPK